MLSVVVLAFALSFSSFFAFFLAQSDRSVALFAHQRGETDIV